MKHVVASAHVQLFPLVITVGNRFLVVITVENTFPLLITVGKIKKSSFFLKKRGICEILFIYLTTRNFRKLI